MRLVVSGTLMVAAAWMLFTPGAHAKTSWASVTPKKADGKVCIHVGDNDWTYYRLNPGSAIEFTVRGPRQLRIRTRHLGKDGVGRARYTVKIIRDGKPVLTKKVTAGPSSKAYLCGRPGISVGAAKVRKIRVPKGKHTYRIVTARGDPPLAVRILREKKLRTSSWVPLTPEGYDRVCTLILPTGKERKYYHFTETKPLEFFIIGPTTIRLWTRLDCDHEMIASETYSIEAFRDGMSIGIKTFDNVKKHSGVQYKECLDLLPGHAQKWDIKVPKGQHRYKILPHGLLRTGIAGRILMPQRALGNTPG